MKTIVALCLLVWTALAAAPALAQDGYGFAPTPDWVDELPLPEPNPARAYHAEGGRYFLLMDDQRLVTDDAVTYFSRSAIKITGPKGLEEQGKIEATFDPAFETLRFHKVRVWRAGKPRDVSGELKLTVARREERLASGIVDGTLTVFGEIRGLRVGDVIDIEQSKEERFSLWPGAFYERTYRAWTVPLARQRYRLLAPHAAPMTIIDDFGPPPVERRIGDLRERVWDIVDAEPQTYFDHQTVGSDYWKPLAVARTLRWQDVAAWGAPHYALDDELGPEGEDFVEQAKAAAPDLEGRITHLIRLVQNEVRYVADAQGLGGFVPRRPAQVLERRFGDCKDKALLLVALLKRLGVEAYPALTDMDRGDALPQTPPSVWSFDHVVVQILLNGRSYWIDPTISLQGGRFPAMSGLDYGHALPIRVGADLVPIARAPVTKTSVVESFDFSNLADGVTLSVTTTRMGEGAQSSRSYFAAEGASNIANDYLKYYDKLYPGIETARQMRVKDDFESETFTTEESYFIPRAALEDGLAEDFPLAAEALSGVMRTVEPGRSIPLALEPAAYEHVIRMTGPFGAYVPPKAVRIERPFLSFARQGEKKGTKEVELTWRLTVKKEEAAVEELRQYAADAKTIDDSDNPALDLSDEM